jgi:ATP-dependent RNA helicase DDX10/DBP4
MFGRKNQTILSSHYGKLVEQDETSGSNGGDNADDGDFFSLKRANHDLPTDLAENSNLSKRKIRMMKSKKALAKAGPRGTKLVFDDDGQAHELYEFKDVEDIDVEGDGAEFMRKETGGCRELMRMIRLWRKKRRGRRKGRGREGNES